MLATWGTSTGFSPASLFSGGVQGAWYDPSDNTTMFQDAAGTTSVTAVEQAVGLICDKRNGTNFTVRYNLFSFSEQFNNTSGWTASQMTVTANSTAAPDGATTADTLTPTAVSSTHLVSSATFTTSVNQQCTFSVYAKANGYNFIRVQLATGTANPLAYFDVLNGTVGTVTNNNGTVVSTSIESVGNGWFRCVVSALPQSGGFFNQGFLLVSNADNTATFTGNGTSGVFVWGAQFQVGASATTYQPTETYPTSWPSGNHAYQTTSASRPTLRARYNLLTYSEQFDNAAWTLSNVTITQNAAIAPDGTTTADRMVPSIASVAQHVLQTLTVSAVTYIQSIYAKASTYNFLQLLNSQTTDYANFDLTTGTVGTTSGSITASIQNAGNGWYRCIVAYPAFAAGSPNFRYAVVGSAAAARNAAFQGNGTDGILIWGAQVVPTAVFPSNVYQRIAAATDYATGAAFPQYLAFDGTDDSLLTANVDFATVTSDGAARRNLLLNPTQFDAAAWTLSSATVTANATTDPDSTTTADKFIATAVAGFHSILQSSGTRTASIPYTFSFYAKAGEIGFCYPNFSSTLTGTGIGGLVNLTTGAVTSVSAGLTITTQNVGSGWWRIICTATGDSNTTAFNCIVNATNAVGALNFTGDGTSGIFLWGAQLETGSTATAFQNIGTDKMTVFSGLSKLSDAAAGIVAELSAVLTSNNGTFYVISPTGAAGNNYQYASRGTATTSVSGTYVSPITNVVTGQSDIGAPSISLRVNAASVASNAITQGTGNYGTYPLYIGRRNNATLPFNGRIYSLIVRGAASNSSQVAQTERYVASKTPLGVVP